MEQIGFIGAYDKKDLILNIAKIISKLNKSVLIVDATIMQRLRYVIPRVSQAPTYVSEYDGIDVAVGFMNLMSIANYLQKPNLDYDFILIDTDNPQTMRSFMVENSKMNFYVTSYDEFELQRNLEILSVVTTNISLVKVIVSSDLENKHDEYLDYILQNYSVSWREEKVIFPDIDEDRRVTLSNQLTKQINIKNYSQTYKDGIEYIISMILEGIIDQNSIRRMINRKV